MSGMQFGDEMGRCLLGSWLVSRHVDSDSGSAEGP